MTSTAFYVDRTPSGEVTSEIRSIELPTLTEGEVRIAVKLSSLNYKDAMAATGHRGIVKTFPHIPGIDAVGEVVESRDTRYHPGDLVIATGHELGVERWGGWSSYMDAPADWLVPLPDGLTDEESMILGTAGFTAAQCVKSLIDHGVSPHKGPILVTGASGGVGSVAVSLLGKLGYEVVAISGKEDRHDWLRQLHASDIRGRQYLADLPDRPLLKGDFAGAVDTVGGHVLANVLKLISHRGCVACCGVAGGADVPTTVYPFILRGVTLDGIDSAWCPDDLRLEIWQRLASDWKPNHLQDLVQRVALSDVDSSVAAILNGQVAGRVVVEVNQV